MQWKLKYKAESNNIFLKKCKRTFTWGSKLTVKEREEVVGDEARSFGATMPVVDTDVRGGRRGEYLSLVFEVGVRLHHRDRVIS